MNGTKLPVLSVVAACALLACGKGAPAAGAPGKPGGRGPLQFPVQLAPVEARTVEYAVQAVGSVEAFEQVQVTARVAGVVEKVRFAEGEQIAAGAPLVEIEPERFRIAVASARAVLEKAEASRADAQGALARREALNKTNPGLVREEDLQTFRTRVATAAAEVAQARAALDLAQVNLRDAYARAPVSGTIQTRSVQTGQYVQPGTVLATLLRRDPLLLKFEVPEQESSRLAVGKQAFFRVAGLPDELTAKISHVAQSANVASRMVTVIARVEGPGAEALRPGAFAEVRVPVGGNQDAPVVPQTAVRPSERGFLAFVVEDGKARERVLTLGLRTADGLVEVRSGLRPGEQLVVRGAEALKDGAAVRVDQADGGRGPRAGEPGKARP